MFYLFPLATTIIQLANYDISIELLDNIKMDYLY